MSSRAAARRASQDAELRSSCAALQERHAAAQDALRAAADDGDEAQLLAAREELAEAGRAVTETRRWLRAEERIVRRTGEIAELTRRGRLSDEDKAKLQAYQDDVAAMEELVAPTRAALAALGAPAPSGGGNGRRERSGDATVDLPATRMQVRARKAGG
ncbi:hypothetical protein [Streptosporangium sp. G12]